MTKKQQLTALTDPDNLMVVWDDEQEQQKPKRPAKRTVKKIVGTEKRTGGSKS